MSDGEKGSPGVSTKFGEGRSDTWIVPGHCEAATRLQVHQGLIFYAFNSLDLGFNHEAAIDYLEVPLKSIPEEHRGKLAGIIMAFALTAVEADRLARGEEA